MTLLIPCSSLLYSQESRAKELLAQALHFSDLYNWADAAPVFTQAEQVFTTAGDQRNALYAKLGRIRSNIDHDQQQLPAVSAELAEALDDNPLLREDEELRMFCLIVKGDIDTETNTGAMRQDWEQVQSLARDLGKNKWQYRALAQLGIAAFYDGDLEKSRTDVGAALSAATAAGDAGAQIRILTIMARGLVLSKMYEQALALAENIIKIAGRTPDAGYQFTAEELRIEALISLGQFDSAERIANDVLMQARQAHRASHEGSVLYLSAEIAFARNDRQRAMATLNQAITLGESAGLKRLLADVYGRATEIYRKSGDLEKAELYAESAAASTQASGDVWAVPQRLQELAELHVARGRYEEADRVYDRAEAFLDAMIGNVSTVLEKTAVIIASSQIYSQHFALVAEHLDNPGKAYAIIEQARGRVAADLLAAGYATPLVAKTTERQIAQVRLKLMAARSTNEIRGLRDQMLMIEQSRSVTPGISVLKRNARETVTLDQIQQSLPPSMILLEYVLADLNSYCLVISRNEHRIVRLEAKSRIEQLIAAYLKAVKAKARAAAESGALYNALLGPIRAAGQVRTVVIVRDGQLHLIPFDALTNPAGRFVVETQNVLYSPSATIFHLLNDYGERPQPSLHRLLAVGGIPYSGSSINRSGLVRGDAHGTFADLPSSGDEVDMARAAFSKGRSTVLVGRAATEAAFKAARLTEYGVIHLAVHAFADPTFPERAALVLLSDRPAGEDGFLQASEVVQLRFNADLVVLSACDTAVGPLQGQEGIANLSKAFLLAGARAVVSTVWQIDDSSSLFLMKRFYAHLLEKQSPAAALTAAKRDMLRTFGRNTVPYQWAGFTIEGAATRAISLR